MKKVFSIVLLSLSIFSCEKVIDLPLNDADQKVVIEAVTSDFIGDSYILVSKTGTVYEQSTFDKVNDAIVTITDKNGLVTTFTEDGNGAGRYINPSFVVSENNNYTLKVKVDNEVYTSKTITQTKISMNYAITQKVPIPIGNGTDSTNIVFLSFNDLEAETNYYRFKIFRNGKYTKTLFIGDDKLINGQLVESPLYGDDFDSGDSLLIELQNLDKANYTYFYSLSNAQSDNPFSAAPANPVSNIDNEALGYFGTYLKDTISLIVP